VARDTGGLGAWVAGSEMPAIPDSE
jgi:hypothetical protein